MVTNLKEIKKLSPEERIKKLKKIEKENKKEINEAEYRNPVVKVDKDVSEFIGTDEKKYFLRKNDLISLPPDMSKMLVERGVAEKIDILA